MRGFQICLATGIRAPLGVRVLVTGDAQLSNSDPARSIPLSSRSDGALWGKQDSQRRMGDAAAQEKKLA